MKIFKKLATLSMALTFVLGLGALTACNGDDSSSAPASSSASASVSSEENKNYTCYEFIVLDKDGNKVGDGYNVQLCMVNANGSLGSCLMPIAVVNGVCEYTFIKTPGIYEVHIVTGSQDEGYSDEGISLKEVVKTSADAFGEYTVQLAE